MGHHHSHGQGGSHTQRAGGQENTQQAEVIMNEESMNIGEKGQVEGKITTEGQTPAREGLMEEVESGKTDTGAMPDRPQKQEVHSTPSVEELLARLKASQDELLEVRMRAQAELENYKKRLEREHCEHLKYAAEQVMKDLIPTLDNLELAIGYGSQSEACQEMLKGIAMTRKLLLDAVGRHGLVCVGREGDIFDPALHEAVGFDNRPELAADTVAKVLQSGYSLQGRLVRPAKVMVNKL